MKCHDCSSTDVYLFDEYSKLPRVTSDTKPWPDGGKLILCHTCGLVQALIDAQWQKETGEIYGDYVSYYQSGGVEQAVYDPTTGEAVPRSEKLLLEMIHRNLLPDPGRLVDVGCGSGGFLKACSKHLTGWQLEGLEQATHYEDEIKSIPGVTAFHSHPAEQLKQGYSLISMLHVFEHIPSPSDTLAVLGEKLADDGVFFIQVPTYEDNPFELLVADHSSHFSERQLFHLLDAAGCPPIEKDAAWLPKELSIVTRRPDQKKEFQPDADDLAQTISLINGHLEWLSLVRSQAESLCQQGPFGIFGSSIAATWIMGIIGAGAVEFFVDEDPSRVGRDHFGKPILTPNQVAAGSSVFLPIAPAVARNVTTRLRYIPINWVVPDSSKLSSSPS